MLFVCSILITIPQLLLVLNVLFDHLCEIGHVPEDSTVSSGMDKRSNRWPVDLKNASFENPTNHDGNPFLRDSSGKIDNVTVTNNVTSATGFCCDDHDSVANSTVQNLSSFSLNTSLIECGSESDALQAVKLQVIDNVDCAIMHGSSISAPAGIAPSMVCAGTPWYNWQKDTCYGDSGGPLQDMVWSDPPIHRIIGITSSDPGAPLFNSPGVYIRVSHYLDWIRSYVLV